MSWRNSSWCLPFPPLSSSSSSACFHSFLVDVFFLPPSSFCAFTVFFFLSIPHPPNHHHCRLSQSSSFWCLFSPPHHHCRLSQSSPFWCLFSPPIIIIAGFHSLRSVHTLLSNWPSRPRSVWKSALIQAWWEKLLLPGFGSNDTCSDGCSLVPGSFQSSFRSSIRKGLWQESIICWTREGRLECGTKFVLFCRVLWALLWLDGHRRQMF